MPRSTGSICRARRCVAAGIESTDPKTVVAHPNLAAACAPVIARAKAHFAEAAAIMKRCPRASVKSPRLMYEAYQIIFATLLARGFAPPRTQDQAAEASIAARPAALRPVLMSRVHIVGAGLAGLAAALRLADGTREIIIHESATHAGGRCRSYFDATLGMEIDNGNHLLLSGNYAARDFLRLVGSEDQLVGPEQAEFAFVDLATRERWTLKPSDGAIPWWVFQKSRRVPGTGPLDYFSVLPLLTAGKRATLKDAMACKGVLWERLWHPFFLAALNTAAGGRRGLARRPTPARNADERRAGLPPAGRGKRPFHRLHRPGPASS